MGEISKILVTVAGMLIAYVKMRLSAVMPLANAANSGNAKPLMWYANPELAGAMPRASVETLYGVSLLG